MLYQKKKKKNSKKIFWDLEGNSRLLRDPTIRRRRHSYLSVARQPRRREDTMILMRILRFNDHGRGTLADGDGRGADWEVVTGGLSDRGSRADGSRRHGCLSLSARWQKKIKTIPANGRRNQCAGGADQRAENDETRFMTRQMWREEKILFSV